MIITKLKGGLGNQMFQYAAGLALAIHNGTVLRLDIDHFKFVIDNDETPRQYELGIFLGDFRIASNVNLARFFKYKLYPHYFIFKWYKWFKKPQIIREKQINFHSDFFIKTPNAYLDGHWMSEKYFLSISSILRSQFKFKSLPNKYLQEIYTCIHQSESVSIHFRRGDYVTNVNANSSQGVCELNYYNQSVKHLQSVLVNPFFFIFSDDIEWVKNNWHIEIPHLYVVNPAHVHHSEDMRMMSLCKHNVIANSTYSWWAAWLNENSQKIVIAPIQWFQDTSLNAQDILPQSWIQI